MTLEQVIEIIERYKLRIPPAVYYELLADIQEVEEDQEPTTKNYLGVDLIDREKAIEGVWEIELAGLDNKKVVDMLKDLPSSTPQAPQTFRWCTDCKEYNQEKHCCHRWSNVIRDTVAEIKQESRKGHWEKIELPARDTYECSICGELAYGDGVETKIQLSNFCPNCGADMRADRSEE